MTPGISRGLRFLTCASLLLATRIVSAQTFQLSAADLADSASLDRSMHRLVGEVLDVYHCIIPGMEKRWTRIQRMNCTYERIAPHPGRVRQ